MTSRKPLSFIHGSANYVWSTTSILGKGAAGIVYRGVNKSTGEPVAVKTFPNSGNQYRHYPNHMREFEVLSMLNHENIVKLLAIEEDLETQSKVLVMELCSGGSLGNVLDDPQNQYGLEEKEFLTVLKDLSSGMKYLRDNNISHRDLKPANIMKYIAEDGRSIYKLSDFGTARELKDDQPFMSLHGTEEYLHPDMYKPAVLRHPITKSFKATVDLWSIGVTLYHIAAGTLPFRPFGGRTNRETMIRITTNKASGVISGVQHVENGPIEWSRELPKTCCLSVGLQKLVTPLLAGLLESSSELMWTFEKFFDTVTDIISCQPFHCLYLNDIKEMTIYLKKEDLKVDVIQKHLEEQSGVEACRQWLVYNHEELFSPNAGCTAKPLEEILPLEIDVNHPILLLQASGESISNCNTDGDAQFPALSLGNAALLDHDAALAKTCCSVAHIIQRRIEKLTRAHTQLAHTPPNLLNLLKSKAEKLKARYERVREVATHLDQRLRVLNNCQEAVVKLIPPGAKEREDALSLGQIIQDKKHSSATVNQQLSSHEHRLNSLLTFLSELSGQWTAPSSDRWNEKAKSHVARIRESWQVLQCHKLSKKLSFHDEQFHMLEKVKIHQTSQKLLSLFQEQSQHCHHVLQHFNTWCRDLETAHNHCISLEEELSNGEMLVNAFNDSLLEAEQEAISTTSSISSKVSSSLSLDSRKSSLYKIKLKMLKEVQQEQRELNEILIQSAQSLEQCKDLFDSLSLEPP